MISCRLRIAATTGAQASQEAKQPRPRASGSSSRVFAVLGRGEPAVYHGERCLDWCGRGEVEDSDVAFAHGGAWARAHKVAGNAEEAARHKRLAREAGDAIVDPDGPRALREGLRDALGRPRPAAGPPAGYRSPILLVLVAELLPKRRLFLTTGQKEATKTRNPTAYSNTAWPSTSAWPTIVAETARYIGLRT